MPLGSSYTSAGPVIRTVSTVLVFWNSPDEVPRPVPAHKVFTGSTPKSCWQEAIVGVAMGERNWLLYTSTYRAFMLDMLRTRLVASSKEQEDGLMGVF